MAFLSVKGDIPLNHIAKLQHLGTHFVARSCRPLPKTKKYSIFFDFCSIYTNFAAEETHHEDMISLIDAARKAVAHGNKVYIIPNPKGITLYNPQVLNISFSEDSFSRTHHICSTE